MSFYHPLTYVIPSLDPGPETYLTEGLRETGAQTFHVPKEPTQRNLGNLGTLPRANSPEES